MRQWHGNAKTLALTAGEFTRDTVFERGVQTYHGQQLVHTGVVLLAGVAQLADFQRFAHNRPGVLARIQRSKGVLEYHGDFGVYAAQLGSVGAAKILAIVQDLPARRLIGSHNAACQC